MGGRANSEHCAVRMAIPRRFFGFCSLISPGQEADPRADGRPSTALLRNPVPSTMWSSCMLRKPCTPLNSPQLRTRRGWTKHPSVMSDPGRSLEAATWSMCATISAHDAHAGRLRKACISRVVCCSSWAREMLDRNVMAMRSWRCGCISKVPLCQGRSLQFVPGRGSHSATECSFSPNSRRG